MKYQVEVTEPLPPDLEIVAERVASMFGIKSAKIRALLERAPGVVTKPISEREATRVIDAFTQAGIWARLLPYEADTPSRLDHHSDTAGNDFADLTEPEPGPEPVLVVPDEPGVDPDSATPPYDYDQESEPPAERPPRLRSRAGHSRRHRYQNRSGPHRTIRVVASRAAPQGTAGRPHSSPADRSVCPGGRGIDRAARPQGATG